MTREIILNTYSECGIFNSVCWTAGQYIYINSGWLASMRPSSTLSPSVERCYISISPCSVSDKSHESDVYAWAYHLHALLCCASFAVRSAACDTSPTPNWVAPAHSKCLALHYKMLLYVG